MNLALSNLLVDRLLGLEYKDWNTYYQSLVKAGEEAVKAQARERLANRRPDTKPSHPLQAYVADYEDPAYGVAEVRLENGTLVWRWSSFRAPLDHYHFDTFTVREERLNDPLLVFTLAADGEIEKLRVVGVEFKKVKK